MTAAAVLTTAERRHFLKKGYVILRGCFTKKMAAPWIKNAYDLLGYDPRDPATWKEEKCSLPGSQAVLLSDFAPRVLDATFELLGGEDRLRDGRVKQSWSDSFQIKFPCGDPSAAEIEMKYHGWHIDGDEVHYLDSPLGLLHYVVWSDLKPRGGGTLIVPPSIGFVARLLALHPEGLHRDAISKEALARFDGFKEVVELAGSAGDVALVHPYMLHSESRNIHEPPRFFTVRAMDLREPLNFNRKDRKKFSPVESVVLNALGVDRLDFKRK
jgi:hypothetical protein